MRFSLRTLCNVLIVVLPIVEHALQAQQRTKPTQCGEYFADRIAYLLGCCGDQPIVDYPGPAFSDQMGPAERATHALTEIENAKRLSCYRVGSSGAKDLMLNAISARLMRAQARSHSIAAADLNAAVQDSEQATRELQSFVTLYPASAQQLWYWIGMAFRHGGNAWRALPFVAGLPAICCEAGEKNAFLGDLYFELGIFDAATENYVLWLESSGQVCGHEAATRNIEELRKRGFQLPPVPKIEPGACVVISEWHPSYIAIPER